MKRFLPKSLVGQLLALVALVLMFAQGVNVLLLYRGAQHQNVVEASAFAVTRIAAGLDRRRSGDMQRHHDRRHFRRARLNFADSSAISGDMKRFSALESRVAHAFENMGLDFLEVRAAKVNMIPQVLSGSVIGMARARQRNQIVGRSMGNRRAHREILGFIIISGKMTDGRWVSIASPVRGGNPFMIHTLLIQTAVLYLIMLLPLILLGRYISKPLKKLTVSAQTFRPGDGALLQESGPPDTRQLIAAFNEMNGRVGAMLDEKDVMLGAIGHDLRTPLAALRVRVENVENDSERERMIAGIEDMDRMLDDILSLARLGRSEEATEPTDVSALIETVCDEFSDMGADVSFNRGERITAPMRGTLIRRALRNLIGNAVKYGGRAKVSVEKTDTNIVIVIDDDGPGIAEEKITAMFEPFTRGEISRNRATGGSGLGLTLARAIARDNGGDVILENLAEGGLRAALLLPFESQSQIDRK